MNGAPVYGIAPFTSTASAPYSNDELLQAALMRETGDNTGITGRINNAMSGADPYTLLINGFQNGATQQSALAAAASGKGLYGAYGITPDMVNQAWAAAQKAGIQAGPAPAGYYKGPGRGGFIPANFGGFNRMATPAASGPGLLGGSGGK